MSNQKRSHKDNASADSPIKRQRQENVNPHNVVEVKHLSPAVFTYKSSSYSICVHKADITRLDVDVIVNLTDKKLKHKSGLAQAISKAAGPELARECEEIIKEKGPVKRTGVVSTTAGNLPCKTVIHAVSPKWQIMDRRAKVDYFLGLRVTFHNAIQHFYDLGLESMALSAKTEGFHGLSAKRVSTAIYDIITFNLRKAITIHVVDTKDDVLDLLIDLLYRNSDFKPEPNSVVARKIPPRRQIVNTQLQIAPPKPPRRQIVNAELQVPPPKPPRKQIVNTELQVPPPKPPRKQIVNN